MTMSAKVFLDDGTAGVQKSLMPQPPVALLAYRILEARETCQILIFSENFSTYERAAEVCRRMQSQLGGDLEFDFKCWSFFELADPECARAILKDARISDIILFSIQGVELPAVAVEWLETLPAYRARAEGALALVLNASSNPAAVEKLVSWMDQSAQHMGMDLLQLAIPAVASVVVPTMFATNTGFSEHQECNHWGLND